MKDIKVSVIIPIYNVEKYIKRCIESITNQTLKEIEIILIDDESPDHCGKICDEYAKNDERIKVVHQENKGLGLSRNVGISMAKGEYVAFIDSDDFIDQNAYEEMYKKAKTNHADICFCDVQFLDCLNKKKTVITNPFNQDIFKGKEQIRRILYNMLECNNETEKTKLELGGVWKAIYKREIFEKYEIMFCSEREFISEDYIFHLDYIPLTKCITFVSNVFYYHCDNDTSLTQTYKKDRLEKNEILYRELLRKTKEMGIYEDVKKGISSLFIGSVRVCIKQEVSNNSDKAIKNIKNICNNKTVKSNVKIGYRRTIKQMLFDILIYIGAARMLYTICKKVV